MDLFATNMLQTFICVFVPNFFNFVDYLQLLLESSSFKNFLTRPLFVWEIWVVRQDTFYLHQDYEKYNFYKKSRLQIIGRSLRDEKVTTYTQLVQKWNLSNKIWQKLVFLLTLSDYLWCSAEGNWKSRVCSMCKLWVYRLFEKQR